MYGRFGTAGPRSRLRATAAESEDRVHLRIRRHADIPDDGMAYLLQRADDWRDGATERGFSMGLGRLGAPVDGQCAMLECMDSRAGEGAGGVEGAAVFVPWGPRGPSLDLMRRDRDADNGLMQLMVIALLQRAGEIGITQVSLNFAVFRSVFERGGRLGAGPVLRLWRSFLGPRRASWRRPDCRSGCTARTWSRTDGVAHMSPTGPFG